MAGLLINPVEHVSQIDLPGKQQRRPALTDDEVQKLLAVAGTRSLLYTAACYTGLRQNELRLLCWGDLHLDGDKPHIVARASTTKNGKDAVLTSLA
jgi:integrase